MKHFVNNGYGWTCRHCRREETTAARVSVTTAHAPVSLAKAKRKNANRELASNALARWRDESHRELVCPKCGVAEKTDER